VKRLVTNRSEMAPERSNKKDGKGKESQPPSGEWTYSKCSNNDLLNLVSEGLLQGKNLINWRPSFRQSLPMENVDEIILFYHFSERGLALPTCSFFRGLLYFYSLSSIISFRTRSATLLFSSTFVKLSLELNPIGIFCAISSM
jgi:hypothetical protein